MDLDGFPEDGAAAAIVAALALLTAPPMRRRLRRVAVTGLALGLAAGQRFGGAGLRGRIRTGSPPADGLEDIIWPPRPAT